MRRRSLGFGLAALLSVVALASVATEARAQGRRGGRGGHYGYGGYYRPYYSFYYDPFFSPFWYPYPVFYPPYGWYGARYAESAVRIEVVPREAKVFVDGYYAGVVDDFDGTFQRLRVQPGKHEILVYLEGYRSIRQTMYLAPDSTYKIRGEMTKLAPSDPPEPPPPAPPPPPPGQGDRVDMPFGPPQPPPTYAPPRPDGPPPREPEAARSLPSDTRFGRLIIRVQPADAEIVIDGERWLTPETSDRLTVNITEGKHHLEVHKVGFQSFSTEVDVRRGESTPINVSLPSRE